MIKLDREALERARFRVAHLRAAEAGGCFNPDDDPQGECADGDCYCSRQIEKETEAAITAYLAAAPAPVELALTLLGEWRYGYAKPNLSQRTADFLAEHTGVTNGIQNVAGAERIQADQGQTEEGEVAAPAPVDAVPDVVEQLREYIDLPKSQLSMIFGKVTAALQSHGYQISKETK